MRRGESGGLCAFLWTPAMTDLAVLLSDDPPPADALRNFAFGQMLDALLRLGPACAEPFGYDFTRMFVFFAAARASVSHLNHHHCLRADAVKGVFPDELRRPVSILSVSSSLGLPYETVRRHMHRLVEDGWCERVSSREFLVRGETMGNDAMSALASKTFYMALECVRWLTPVVRAAKETITE